MAFWKRFETIKMNVTPWGLSDDGVKLRATCETIWHRSNFTVVFCVCLVTSLCWSWDNLKLVCKTVPVLQDDASHDIIITDPNLFIAVSPTLHYLGYFIVKLLSWKPAWLTFITTEILIWWNLLGPCVCANKIALMRNARLIFLLTMIRWKFKQRLVRCPWEWRPRDLPTSPGNPGWPSLGVLESTGLLLDHFELGLGRPVGGKLRNCQDEKGELKEQTGTQRGLCGLHPGWP